MINLRSIYARLILWYSTIVIITLLVFGAYIYHSLQARLYEDLETRLTRRAQIIAEKMLDMPQAVIAHDIHDIYSPEENNRFIRIRKDNAPFYISGQPKEKLFDVNKIPVTPQVKARRMEKVNEDDEMMIVTVQAGVDGSSYTVEIGALTDDVESVLHNLVITLLIGLPIVIPFIAFGGYILVRRSLKPVENIRATAEKITFGNFRNRLPVQHTGDALENLSLTLNQMLERLEYAYEQAQRFSADASHELRTPLTITRGELESLLKQDLPEGIIGSVGSVLEEIERLSHITESLFAISRLDAGEAKIMHVKFDLADLVKTTTEQMQLLAVEKSIALKIDTRSAVNVEGDPARLKQIIVNLLDNAIKYTPDNGNISIRVYATGSKAVFEIADSGIGISKEALPHIFERFYRASKARSREVGGAGLGLSIVRSIALAHSGTIDMQSIEGKGTTCRVELPLAS